MEYLLLIFGFTLLLFGGRFLVSGSVALANRFNLSPLVIGLTVVSFGTSAPELFVSAAAALKNHPEVAIGNVIGSNVANVALVLALTAMIFPISVRKNTVKIDAPFMIVVSLLLWLFMSDGSLKRWEGGAFILFLAGYTVFLLRVTQKNHVPENENSQAGQMGIIKIIGLIVLAYLGLAFGSELLVTNASIIAKKFGVSERVIAITIVAFGTSLPELVTSVMAAFKKEMEISIGNIIGSNIFNILAVLGVTSILKPIAIAPDFLSKDIFWMLATSAMLFLFILPFKGGTLTRFKGTVLFLTYCIYILILYF